MRYSVHLGSRLANLVTRKMARRDWSLRSAFTQTCRDVVDKSVAGLATNEHNGHTRYTPAT